MDAWIPITLAAATAQTLRFMLQRHLKVTRLSTAGATFARYLYSAPLVVLLALAYVALTGTHWPAMGAAFAGWALAGAVAQILATMALVALFAERNFAVGITLKKTEVLLTALVGLVLLGEGVSGMGAVAVALGFTGVVLLSLAPVRVAGGFLRQLANRASGLGLASGAFFAIAAVSYRAALLSLGSGDVLLRALATLAVVTSTQTLIMGVGFALRDPGQIRAVLQSWRVAGLVGLASLVGSVLWFSAFALQNAAYVHALGQVEVVLSTLASLLIFHERISLREALGMVTVIASVLLLVLFI